MVLIFTSMGLWAGKTIKDLSGIYASDMFGKVNVTKKDKGRYLATSENGSYILTEGKNHTYSVKYNLFSFMPISIGDMKKVLVYRKGKYIFVKQEGKEYKVAVKANPVNIPKAWKSREGTYIRMGNKDKNKKHVVKIIAKNIDGCFVLKVYLSSGDTVSLILDIQDNNHGIIMSPNKKNRKILYVKNKRFEIDGSIYKKIK